MRLVMVCSLSYFITVACSFSGGGFSKSLFASAAYLTIKRPANKAKFERAKKIQKELDKVTDPGKSYILLRKEILFTWCKISWRRKAIGSRQSTLSWGKPADSLRLFSCAPGWHEKC